MRGAAAGQRQFLLFLLTGGLAGGVNVASRIGFSQVMRFEWAVLAAYAVGMAVAYVLMRRTVFPGTSQGVGRSLAAFALVNLVAVLQTWLVSLGLRSLLLPLIGVGALVELIAHGTGVVVPVFTSFYGHKTVTFRDSGRRRGAPFAIRSAFVLGSTSGVAQAICRELAARGCSRFHLVARNGEANGRLAAELQQRFGAVVSTEHTDLLADAALEPVRRPEVGEFDLYLIAAGSLGEAELARSDAGEALRILAANVGGLIPWLTAIATPERISRPGRLWLFSSVAADRGRPSNYHYGAAKAALTAVGEGLLLRCHGKPFAVRIIKAGFMATAMTVGKAPAALCASTESVARDLLRRPDRRGIEYLPWWWGPLLGLVRRLPAPLAARL